MKKKIRDMNYFEIKDTCDNYLNCSTCPLKLVDKVCILDFIHNLDLLSDKVLDREVEVEDE